MEEEGKEEVGGRSKENAIEMRKDKIEHFEVLILGVGRGREGGRGVVHDVVGGVEGGAEEQAGRESGTHAGDEAGGADERGEEDVGCDGGERGRRGVDGAH